MCSDYVRILFVYSEFILGKERSSKHWYAIS